MQMMEKYEMGGKNMFQCCVLSSELRNAKSLKYDLI